jgi:hypothetical protein
MMLRGAGDRNPKLCPAFESGSALSNFPKPNGCHVAGVSRRAPRAKIALVSFSRRVREVYHRIGGKHRAAPGAPGTTAIFTPYTVVNFANPSDARSEIRVFPVRAARAE